MTENEIAAVVVDTCFKIHSKLGAGLFESVYEEILFYELNKRELRVEKQKSIPVFWDDLKMDVGFRADLIINDKVIIEIKSIETINPVHKKQLLTYLKITGLKLGLLINSMKHSSKMESPASSTIYSFCVSAPLRETL